MSKKQKKNKPHFTFNDILAKDINESIQTSSNDIENQKISDKNYREQNLALSFKYLTENKDFNFQYFLKNKTNFESFTKRLNNTLIKITSHKVKDLYNNPFKDKFPISKLKAGAYNNSNKQFNGTEQIISVELSSKDKERIILYHEDKEEDGRNILYVLGFDFNHNMYEH